MTINTDNYKCGRCSKKNWELGTRNDYMIAINGITRTLYNMREVMWQLELFRGNSFLMSEYDENNKEENYHLSDRYVKFLSKNTIKYYDRLCGFERTQYLSEYGWMQGYFNIGEVMEKLKAEGIVRVPFKWLYDIRQYDKAIYPPFLSYDVQLLPVVTPHLLSKFIKQCINIMAIAYSSRTLCFKS